MKYLIIFLLLLPGLKSIAQKNKNSFQESIRGTILEINPNGDGFTKTRLPFGSTVKFKITNVNPFIIEGTNSISKESISFDVPVQLSQSLANSNGADLMVLENIGKTVIDPLKKLSDLKEYTNNNNLYSYSNLKENLIEKKDRKQISDYQNKQLEIIDKQLKLLEMLKQQQDSITALKSLFINNYNGFAATLNKLSLYTSVDSYIDSLLQETFIIDTATLKFNLNGYMVSINDDKTDINLLRGKCITALEDLNKHYINAKGAYDELAKKMKNEKLILHDWEAKNKDAKIKIESLNISLIREKIFEKEFQFLTSKYDTINSSNKRTAIITKTNYGVDYYNRVQNAKFEVYTDAQQLSDDKITITPKLKDAKGNSIKEYSPVEIKTYGGWKVDVSTGYLLSFRGDDNFSNMYDSNGITGVQKNRRDNLKHAIGALFNAYPRTGRDLNFGFSVGVSIPTDGTSIGFYGGFSFLMMEKNRLVISFGLAENRVKLLNTGNLIKDNPAGKISNKETYRFSHAGFKEIKYDNVYRPSFFIGISYNLFTIKKAE